MDEMTLKKFFPHDERDINDAVRVITEYVEHAIQYKKDAEEMVHNWNKNYEIAMRDERIKQLQDELADSFSFNKRDRERVKKFYSDHCRMGHNPVYQFTPLEVALCCEIVCSCGEKIRTFN